MSIYETGEQLSDFIPKQINKLTEEIKARDPELAEKIKKLKTELMQLKEDLIKLIEDIKKPVLERYNELKEEAITKSKPIVKRWTPIIKDVEVGVLLAARQFYRTRSCGTQTLTVVRFIGNNYRVNPGQEERIQEILIKIHSTQDVNKFQNLHLLYFPLKYHNNMFLNS